MSASPLEGGLSPLPPCPAVEPSPRWVRVRFGGKIIADSKRVLLLRQYDPGRLPTYCFPAADVRMEVRTPGSPESPVGDVAYGDVAYWAVQVGDRIAERAAWVYLDPPADLAALRGYVSFAWEKMDAWYEEEEADAMVAVVRAALSARV
jgi:uncharacterized protein (DUF427 family)